MVSYYNPLAMYRHQQQATAPGGGPPQFHHPASPAAGWYGAPTGYQPPPHQVNTSQQYLNCVQEDQHQAGPWHHHHHHMFQPEWGTGTPDFGVPPTMAGVAAVLEESQLPSPPITVSSSELSSPGAAGGTLTPPQQHGRPVPVRSPYEWMKKPSYQSQPNPDVDWNAELVIPSVPNKQRRSAGSGSNIKRIADWLRARQFLASNEEYPRYNNPGKTRTKDKYRVVYSDHQRLELEKEFHYSRYITIRRKAELAAALGLSERQVKIWFQNRRAKERKQVKKREEMLHKEKMEAANVTHQQLQHQHLGPASVM